jgi:predicted nucleic acid-binding protein
VILVDTSVWVEHLRAGEAALAALLEKGQVLTHPFVIGELALGNLRNRDFVMAALTDLPSAVVATDAEVIAFIDRYALFGRGIGYVDAHLLAAARLTAGASLWTNDKRLKGVGETLGLAAPSPRGSIGMPTEGAWRLAWRGLK